MDELYQRFADSLAYLSGDPLAFAAVFYRLRYEKHPSVESRDYLLPRKGARWQLLRDYGKVVYRTSLDPEYGTPVGKKEIWRTVKLALHDLVESDLTHISRAAFDQLVEAFSRSCSLEANPRLWLFFSGIMVEGREQHHLWLWEHHLWSLMAEATNRQLSKTAAVEGSPTERRALNHNAAMALEAVDFFDLAKMVDKATGAEWANPYSIVVVAYVLRHDPPLWDDFKRQVGNH
jgi:hypothetical protein